MHFRASYRIREVINLADLHETTVADPTPIDADQIALNANGAEQFTGDGQSVKQVPIPDQIEAAKFTAAQNSKRKAGIRFLKMKPPSARGDC